MLDGKPFGTEKIIDKDGNIYAGFYEKGGMVINAGENSKISEISTNFMSSPIVDEKVKQTEDSEYKITDEERDDLYSFLPTQTGELHKNPVAIAQGLRWDMAFASKNDTSKSSGSDESKGLKNNSFVLSGSFDKSIV